MTPSPHRPKNNNQTISIRGRRRPYRERRRIGRCDYFLLEPVGSPLTERYLAFDPLSGPGGDFFQVQLWHDGPLAQQKLRLLSRLKNDNLPRAVQWQRRDGNVEVVLTWTDGIPLSNYLKIVKQGRRPPPEPREVVRLIRGLASAVCRLHQEEQIAHGDIQPENVIITDHSSRLVLIDFGSAWTIETTANRNEGDGVRRSYAAPELQCGGKVNGFLADQFSVSVLFYQMLTQKLPYAGRGGKAGRPERIAKMLDSFVLPSKVSDNCRRLPKSLQEGIDRLAKRGLALRPEGRYPDRHPWLDDLFEVYANFRLPPKPPPFVDAVTRVISWLVPFRRTDH